jgi:hypothetical protein
MRSTRARRDREAPVAEPVYDTTTAGLVELDGDGDAEYESVGLGYQNDGEYGTVVYGYSHVRVRSISFSQWIFETDTDDYIQGGSSMGIADLSFRRALTIKPAPSSALLAGLGLVGLGLHARRSRRTCP